MAVTKNLAQYTKDKAVNLSAMSRATGISYACLYASLGEKGRNRPLSIDEAILVCKFLEVDPRDFADKEPAVK
ncbi:MAG: helix-turn-helix transcriptional regulator [Lachnospiraceae bacterium]